MTRRAAWTLAALLCGSLAAAAQDKPVEPAPPRPPGIDPQACAPGDRLEPGQRNPTVPPGTTGESLSEKLARTDGVICPPNVDPDIRAPAPGGGRTPVIPPPGSGDPTVRPK